MNKTLVTAFALTTGILLSGCGTAEESTEKAPAATEEVDLTAETDCIIKSLRLNKWMNS